MEVDDAIRTRRTTKSFTPVPLADDVVRDLLALAVLAPNHHETEPWRFWVAGRETIEQLSRETGDVKLLRSHTAIVAGVTRNDDPVVAEEDFAAVACALQNVLLGACARGLAGFWRTPGVMRGAAFRAVLDVPDDVRLVGVVHLGHRAEPLPPTPERHAEPFTTWRT